jgi:hypothetical protein
VLLLLVLVLVLVLLLVPWCHSSLQLRQRGSGARASGWLRLLSSFHRGWLRPCRLSV